VSASRKASAISYYARKAGREFRIRRWRAKPYVSDSEPIVVGGAGRSGTTLLRVILDSHPHISCGPESNLFLPDPVSKARLHTLSELFDLDHSALVRLRRSSGSQAEFIDRFFEMYCELTGKPRWAEKTPRNVRVIDFVFERFPGAKFVHMIRDGRDTACSLRTHPTHRVISGQVVPVTTRNPFDLCIRRWMSDVRAGLEYAGRPGYVELRYEQLVADPEPALRELFAQLDEPWDASVLDFHSQRSPSRELERMPQNPGANQPLYASAIGRWRRDMSREEAELFKQMAGSLLVDLGYERDDQWWPDPDPALGRASGS
jgi:protein-tyrosine sulfotransferase